MKKYKLVEKWTIINKETCEPLCLTYDSEKEAKGTNGKDKNYRVVKALITLVL
jgi:hypothetical protein